MNFRISATFRAIGRAALWSPGLRGACLAVALAAAVLAGPPAMAAKGDCSQPSSSGSNPTTGDCFHILRAAVAAVTCADCICDVNGSGSLTSTDALQCLKKAVGQAVTLKCPPCGSLTTTTLGGNSTTSTSTTSSTTTIPVRCDGNGDCSDLPDEFRCNPFTDTCEKPCTRDTHCKDFYECNKTTGYCQEPPFLF